MGRLFQIGKAHPGRVQLRQPLPGRLTGRRLPALQSGYPVAKRRRLQTGPGQGLLEIFALPNRRVCPVLGQGQHVLQFGKARLQRCFFRNKRLAVRLENLGLAFKPTYPGRRRYRCRVLAGSHGPGLGQRALQRFQTRRRSHSRLACPGQLFGQGLAFLDGPSQPHLKIFDGPWRPFTALLGGDQIAPERSRRPPGFGQFPPQIGHSVGQGHGLKTRPGQSVLKGLALAGR